MGNALQNVLVSKTGRKNRLTEAVEGENTTGPIGTVVGQAMGQIAAEEAALAAEAAKLLKPFDRPTIVPDTTEQRRADRRRSISAAMRRRAQSSILTSAAGGGGTGDALGA